MKEFKVGDAVRWATEKVRDTSRDKGNYGYKAKEVPVKAGVVERVLQPGDGNKLGLPARDHVSYLVRSRGMLLQPPVSRMELDNE